MKTKRSHKTTGKARNGNTRRKTTSKKTSGLKKTRLKRTIESIKSSVRQLEKQIK
jgi:hypothetical protein